MNNRKKLDATRELLESQGDSPEQIQATINLIAIHDKEKSWESIRSWIGVITGVCALVVSIVVAVVK